MKFLVRRLAIQPIPLAPGDLAALAVQQLDCWERLSKSGHVLFTAPFVGRRARVAIYEAASNEELFGLINDDPLFPYLECEVVPPARMSRYGTLSADARRWWPEPVTASKQRIDLRRMPCVIRVSDLAQLSSAPDSSARSMPKCGRHCPACSCGL
jgi:muconolactone delta-isomerase